MSCSKFFAVFSKQRKKVTRFGNYSDDISAECRLALTMLTGVECSQRLGDLWYALDAVWRTAQFMHLIAAALDAVWQVSAETRGVRKLDKKTTKLTNVIV